jgi:hypothetical protein
MAQAAAPGRGILFACTCAKKAAQRITESHHKRILKIKRIIDIKHNEYTFSIFRK